MFVQNVVSGFWSNYLKKYDNTRYDNYTKSEWVGLSHIVSSENNSSLLLLHFVRWLRESEA